MVLIQDLKCMSAINDDGHLFCVEIMAIKEGRNLNDYIFPADTLLEYGESFRGKPILCAYKGMKIGDNHNYDEYIDPKTMELVRDFRGPNAERIVGYIPEDASIEIRIIDGKKWLVVQGVLWKFYCAQLVDDIINKKFKNISVEVNADDITNQEDGSEIFNRWEGLGITILGDDVQPAVTGASLKKLASTSQYKALSAKADKYRVNQKGDEDMNVQEKLAKICAAIKGCEIVDTSEDERYALLLDSDSQFKVCPLVDVADENSEIKLIVPRMTVSIKTPEGKECGFDIQSCENKAVENMQKKCAEKDERIKKLEAELEDVKKEETARRNSDVVKALKDKYESDKELLDENERIPEEKFNAIVTEAENGAYKDCKDKDGKFSGVKEAMKKYYAERGIAADNCRTNSKKTRGGLSWTFEQKSNNSNGEFDADELIAGLQKI